MQDCARKNRNYIPLLRGEESPNSKFSEIDVRAIRSSKESNRALGRFYHVDKGTIAAIRKRLTWKHI